MDRLRPSDKRQLQGVWPVCVFIRASPTGNPLASVPLTSPDLLLSLGFRLPVEALLYRLMCLSQQARQSGAIKAAVL